jgi:hypothetical protein
MALFDSLLLILVTALVSLVSLRQGTTEAIQLLFWAILPFLALYLSGEDRAILLVAIVIIACVCSLILRQTSSWSLVLSVSVVLCSLCGILVFYSTDSFVADLDANFQASLALQTDPEVRREAEARIKEWSGVEGISGMLAYLICAASTFGVIVGRWLQSILYNPGGFRQELHGLRLSMYLALICALLVIAAIAKGWEMFFWLMVISMPLTVAGLGFLHWKIAQKGWKELAVIALYVCMVLTIPLGPIVIVVIAFLDSIFDFRKKDFQNK